MERYATIRDITKMPCYSNMTARLVYLHIACRCDVRTYDYHHSLRYLASEIGCSLQQVRTAVKMLERDGLVRVSIATRQTTQALTHLSTQQTTHLHVVRVNELDTATDTATNTVANTAANTAANTDNNNLNKKNYTLTHDACVRARMENTLEEALGLPEDQALTMVDAFLKRQDIKKKKWNDEDDMLAHLISWCEKRMPRPEARTRTRIPSDHEARVAERQRTMEEAIKESPEEKAREEAAKLRRWIKDARRNGREELAQEFEKELSKLTSQLPQ